MAVPLRMIMQQPPDRYPAPPPPNIGGPPRPKRTARTWWAATGVGVLLAVLWASSLFLLGYAWILAAPVWIVIMLVLAVICFINARRYPSALAYGIAVLCSMPLAVGLIVGLLILTAPPGVTW
jgi:hypothetical protein